MSRDGSGIYSLPSGTNAVSGATIESAKYNTFLSDLVSDLNAARPITAGGTGATSASGARTALGVQALDATLTALAGLTFSATDAFLRASGADTFVAEPASAHRTALGLTALATTAPGTGVATALGVNIGSAGAPVLFNGALGTPSSGTLTNATGLPVSSGISGLGTNVATALAIAIGSAGAVVTSSSTDTLSNKTLSSPAVSGTITHSAGAPTFKWIDSFGATNEKRWQMLPSGGTFYFQTLTDADSATTVFKITRSAGVPTAFDIETGALTKGGVTVPTISSSDTLTNKTVNLANNTLTGTLAEFNTACSNADFVSLTGSETLTNKVLTAPDINGGTIQSRVQVSAETSGTLTAASANKRINATGDITFNDGVFTAGDCGEIYAGASSRSIIQDTGMTLRLDGTATTGTRTLAPRGRLSWYALSNSEIIVSGIGVT